MKMEKTYSSSEIQRIAKITKMQAIHWTQTGVITPLQDAKGRGSRRIYSWQNLIELMVCRELNKYNVERSLMKRVIDYFQTPSGRYSSYWDYLAQIPKMAQEHYIIITPNIREKQYRELIINEIISLGGYRNDNESVRNLNTDELIEKYQSLGGEFQEHARNEDGSLPGIFIITKMHSKSLIECITSCVLVNMNQLIIESAEGSSG